MSELNYFFLFWGMLSWLEGIISIILFIIHIKRSCYMKTRQNLTSKWGKFLKIINNAIFVLYISYFILSGIYRNQLSGLLTIDPNISCFIFQPILLIMFHLSRILMFSILLTRIQTAFRGSIYQYNPKCINSLYITMCLICGVFIVGDKYGMELKLNGTTCVILIDLWAKIAHFVIDFLYSLVLLYMFVKPMKILERKRRNSECHNHDNSFKDLIVKYYLLTFISILSTIVLYCISIIENGTEFSVLDSFVNYICIYLLIGPNKDMYYCICNRCHILSIKCYHINVNKRKLRSISGVSNKSETNTNESKTNNNKDNLERYLHLSNANTNTSSPGNTPIGNNSMNNPEITLMRIESTSPKTTDDTGTIPTDIENEAFNLNMNDIIVDIPQPLTKPHRENSTHL